MIKLRVLMARFKGLFAKQEQDRELHEELQAHLEMLVEENRRKGMPAEEARRVAGVALGGIAQTEELYRKASCVGLYGTMAYAVARKTNEIGVRMALGAERGAILGMVLRETAMIVLTGIAVGVPAAWIASSLLKTRLFGLTPHDPWSIGLSVVATLLVTMLAGYIPARRASKVDPMVALRYE